MKKLILFAFMIISASAPAQNAFSYKIMGTVSEAQTKVPLPGANVTALTLKDSSLITGSATDEKGRFVLSGIKERNVKLKISMIGYQATFVNLTLDKGDVDLGRIEIKQSVYELGEAVVQAQKPMIEFQIDKEIVNIDRTPESGGSVTDALRSSGAVKVDPSTNKISVRGGADTKIWIDGKPAQMSDDMLAQLPASSVDKVEIMTNPSAKDDPEGDSGIINIITKKGGLGTFSGSASVNLSTKRMYNGSFVLNYKINKFSLYGNFGSYFAQVYRKNSSKVAAYSGNSKYLQETQANTDVDGQFYNGKLGADYEIDTMNLVSFSGSIATQDYNSTARGNNNYYSRELLWNDSSYSLSNNADNLRYDYSTTAFYKKKFDMKGHDITADVYYSTIDYDNENDYDAEYFYNQSFPERQRYGTHTVNKTFIYKTDYVNPVPFGKIEAGYNFTYRDRANDYSSLYYAYGKAEWLDTMNLSNMFNYKESIHALYAAYSNSIGKLEYKAGLRLEQAYNKGDQRTTGSFFRTDYLSWYPSATLAYNLANNFPLAFNFARRVRRPQMEMINPFVKRTSPYSIEVGNPEIEPTYIYTYELKLERLLNFYHTSAKGSPTGIKIMNPDGTSVTTTVNMASGKTYGVESSLSYVSGDPRMPFTLPEWITMINLNASYFRYESEGFYRSGSFTTDLSSKSDNFSIGTSVNASLWENVTALIHFDYRPQTNDTRSRIKTRTYLYAGFTGNFLDRKLQIRLSLY
ncbi:MAG TPA: TonB-dependent receptor, partial [Ignavibacteriales bacterium]|nr:TonB-dependent receptor [Ignavibacteriales bacterium]